MPDECSKEKDLSIALISLMDEIEEKIYQNGRTGISKDELEVYFLYRDLLNSLPAKKPNFWKRVNWLTIGIAVFVGTSILILDTIQVKTVNVSGELKTIGVSLENGTTPYFPEIRSNRTEIRTLSESVSSDFELPGNLNAQYVPLNIKGPNRAVLARNRDPFGIKKEAGFELTRLGAVFTPNQIDLAFQGNELELLFFLGDTVLIDDNFVGLKSPSTSVGLNDSHAIEVNLDSGSTSVSVDLQTPLNLDLFNVKKIEFPVYRPFTEREYNSYETGITSGKMKVQGLEETIKLNIGDRLVLDEAEFMNVHLTISNDSINLKFSGEVGKFGVFNGEFQRSKKPSLLSWFYTNKRVTFYLSAFMALFTFLFSIRKKIIFS